ncbi:Protein of unknown function [Bacillus mycoides]|uniref:Uncharacterized protein n=1 Tax=Bacillus mycoides TaxID=1405 RepID=A0A1G4EGU5_BACMY|nr:Protein of unknown function [Bacillus mycoides]
MSFSGSAVADSLPQPG